MWDELEVISEGIKVIKRNLLDFVKKVLVFIFLFSRMECVVVIPSLSILGILHLFHVPAEICDIVFKIMLLVGQIIPAASYAGAITVDKTIEGSMDVCFAGVIICLLSIWYAL